MEERARTIFLSFKEWILFMSLKYSKVKKPIVLLTCPFPYSSLEPHLKKIEKRKAIML